ncbi:hypothetical protein DICVIV_10495 [Dictyocaulus viviparus]|uniref:Uncharacterized protein n=1 Tax=Dictyocaulus viviparus TaxID=29172 RepID=A0A0D8XI89_DICVI|nr:hypothetical protein DICVIV_10495 [Dictyocaulus viviparus]
METPPPMSGEKAWFEKVDPDMTQDVLNEMSQEFASIYKSCREWLALTRFVAKGIVKPATPSPNPSRSPVEEKEILPPPPPPPTFHKKVDLLEYKERTKSHAPTSDRSTSERVPSRRSFIPDTSHVRSDLSMPNLSLPGQDSASRPSITSMHDSGHKNKEEQSRREDERRREKERRRREERERHGPEHFEDREKRKEEERRKREHSRSGQSSGSQQPLEKRPRHEPVMSSSLNPGTGSGSYSKSRPTAQAQVPVIASSHSHNTMSNGPHSRRENDIMKSTSSQCRTSESLRTLSPPPPPPPITELEDGEVE